VKESGSHVCRGNKRVWNANMVRTVIVFLHMLPSSTFTLLQRSWK